MMRLMGVLFWFFVAVMLVVPAEGEGCECGPRDYVNRTKSYMKELNLKDYVESQEYYPQPTASEQLPKIHSTTYSSRQEDLFKATKVVDIRWRGTSIFLLILGGYFTFLFVRLYRNRKNRESDWEWVSSYLIGGFFCFLIWAISTPYCMCPVDLRRLPVLPTSNYNFGYAVNNHLALLHSPGLDGVQDCGSLAKLIEGSADSKELELRVQPFTYDPTNGSMSAGDLFRIVEIDLNPSAPPVANEPPQTP